MSVADGPEAGYILIGIIHRFTCRQHRAAAFPVGNELGAFGADFERLDVLVGLFEDDHTGGGDVIAVFGGNGVKSFAVAENNTLGGNRTLGSVRGFIGYGVTLDRQFEIQCVVDIGVVIAAGIFGSDGFDRGVNILDVLGGDIAVTRPEFNLMPFGAFGNDDDLVTLFDLTEDGIA